MQLHQLQPETKQQTKKRIGRGGKRGKTSGRGHKGQNARTGNSGVPQMREIIKKLPKLRGHGVNRAQGVNSNRPTVYVVNVSDLDGAFTSGATVTPALIVKKGLISAKKGTRPRVKVLGDGTIEKALTISGCAVSASAREKVEAAKGKIVE